MNPVCITLHKITLHYMRKYMTIDMLSPARRGVCWCWWGIITRKQLEECESRRIHCESIMMWRAGLAGASI